MNEIQINVEAVANLARLSLNNEEKEAFSKEMLAIIGFATKLSELDLTDIPITAHVAALCNVLRDDVPAQQFERDELLTNAPTKADGCITVPRVVE